MSKHNHFARLGVEPVVPPFLAPDAVYLWLLLRQPDTLDPDQDLARIEAEAGRVVDRHIERMARDHNETLKKPKQLSPLIADSTVGMVFDQAAAQHAALAGRYAQEYFSDQSDRLRADYPELMAIFTEQSQAQPGQVRALLRPALLNAPPNHPLRLLHAAWRFRQDVVVHRQPMSMIPIVSGDAQGDTPSFTPVLQRMSDDTWRLGLPGDAAPVSPRTFKGDIDAVLPNIYAAYGSWYKRDQEFLERKVGEPAAKISDHLYFPVYARRLQTEKTVWFGEAALTNLSHNKLFRLSLPTHEQLFHIAADKAVKLALAAAKGQQPPEPDAAEIEAAYLYLIARRGETAELRKTAPDAKQAAPLNVPVKSAWTVFVNGEARMTVAWLDSHPKAKAVVSGAAYPARAVLLNGSAPPRLGLAPFLFQEPETGPGRHLEQQRL